MTHININLPAGVGTTAAEYNTTNKNSQKSIIFILKLLMVSFGISSTRVLLSILHDARTQIMPT
jgi:hypothetical protein